MSTRRIEITRHLRRSAAFVGVVVAFVIAGGHTAFAAPSIPKPPPAAQPALGAVSPTIWAACNAPAQLLGFVDYAQTLVPKSVPLPFNPTDAFAAVTPVTALLADTCALFPTPPPAPECAQDAAVAALAQIGVPGPIGLVVLQSRVIEDLLRLAGAPVSSRVSAAGGCSKASAPAPTPPAPVVVLDDEPATTARSASSVSPGDLVENSIRLGPPPEVGGAALPLPIGRSLPYASRHFATWVLSVAIIVAGFAAAGASALSRRVRRVPD